MPRDSMTSQSAPRLLGWPSLSCLSGGRRGARAHGWRRAKVSRHLGARVLAAAAAPCGCSPSCCFELISGHGAQVMSALT